MPCLKKFSSIGHAYILQRSGNHSSPLTMDFSIHVMEQCFPESVLGHASQGANILLPNQSGVRQQAAIERQILEAEAGEQAKQFLFKCSVIWEDVGLSVSRLIRLLSYAKHRQNPAIPSRSKNKGNTQISCSILKNHPLEPEAAKWDAIWFPAPSWRLHGAGAAIGHVASSSRVPSSWAVKSAEAPAGAPLG